MSPGTGRVLPARRDRVKARLLLVLRLGWADVVRVHVVLEIVGVVVERDAAALRRLLPQPGPRLGGRIAATLGRPPDPRADRAVVLVARGRALAGATRAVERRAVARRDEVLAGDRSAAIAIVGGVGV